MAERVEQNIGTGRRKTAVARVYLRPGKGKMMVNGEDVKAYFGDRPSLDFIMKAPLRDTQMLLKYDVIVNVHGGGPAGQAVAIRHGITRALVAAHENLRPVLKRAGYLTRDPRMVERKKYGLHKARKASQFSKR